MDDHDTSPSAYPPAVWRVIIHRPADGPTNMAVDEAIAAAVARGDSPTTLRFYAWEPACLSLGRFQPAADVDFARLRRRGWDIVRRLTGGRAILHVDELTYSIVIPDDDPRVAGGLIESYRRLSRGLMEGLAHLGANVQSDRAVEEARNFKGPVCFEVPSDYEITANGKKLIGSAQTRRESIVLQHGAFPLYGDVTRICEALTFDNEMARDDARERVRERATTLEEALGERVSMVRAVGAMMRGFAVALNVQLEEQQLSPEEEAHAANLRETKYLAAEWTEMA